MEIGPFRSARLVYRAIEPAQDEDLFLKIQQDPISWAQSNARIPVPQAQRDANRYITQLEENLLGVVMCLPAPTPDSKPMPIGAIGLSRIGTHLVHHRFAEISIDVLKAYQNQGYGSEAINWIVDWAFETAGLHRVEIRCFGHNEGARRLYERLGFKLEGTSRERLWYKGKWWDDYQLGMLDWEWRALRKRDSGQAKEKSEKEIV